MKILLVEDHPALAEISCRLLRDVHDHQVLHVATGAAAVAAGQTFVPDIVLIDLNLPDTTGYELARQLRADPRFASTSILAVTAFSNPAHDDLAKAAGFDAFFRKPMDFEILEQFRRK